MTSLELLACVVLVATSGFLSASEIALFSLSRFQLRYLRDNFRFAYRRIKTLLSDPSGLLVTILVANELVNVSFATIIAEVIARRWESEDGGWSAALPTALVGIPDWLLQAVVGMLITTPLVLLFCESTPKVMAARMNQLIAPLTSGPLLLVYRLFAPARFVLGKSVGLLARSLGEKTNQLDLDSSSRRLREEEFLLLLEEGHREGNVHANEVELIKNVFEFDDTKVGEIMTPISEVFCLPANAPLIDAITTLQKNFRSRVPVIGTSKTDVRGVLHAKDLISAKLNPKMSGARVDVLMRKAFFVNTQTRLNTLFRKMKANQSHLAVVLDDNDRTAGIITMNDLLEELFEDIFPDSVPAARPVAAPSKGVMSSLRKGGPQ